MASLQPGSEPPPAVGCEPKDEVVANLQPPEQLAADMLAAVPEKELPPLAVLTVDFSEQLLSLELTQLLTFSDTEDLSQPVPTASLRKEVVQRCIIHAKLNHLAQLQQATAADGPMVQLVAENEQHAHELAKAAVHHLQLLECSRVSITTLAGINHHLRAALLLWQPPASALQLQTFLAAAGGRRAGVLVGEALGCSFEQWHLERLQRDPLLVDPAALSEGPGSEQRAHMRALGKLVAGHFLRVYQQEGLTEEVLTMPLEPCPSDLDWLRKHGIYSLPPDEAFTACLDLLESACREATTEQLHHHPQPLAAMRQLCLVANASGRDMAPYHDLVLDACSQARTVLLALANAGSAAVPDKPGSPSPSSCSHGLSARARDSLCAKAPFEVAPASTGTAAAWADLGWAGSQISTGTGCSGQSGPSSPSSKHSAQHRSGDPLFPSSPSSKHTAQLYSGDQLFPDAAAPHSSFGNRTDTQQSAEQADMPLQWGVRRKAGHRKYGAAHRQGPARDDAADNWQPEGPEPAGPSSRAARSHAEGRYPAHRGAWNVQAGAQPAGGLLVDDGYEYAADEGYMSEGGDDDCTSEEDQAVQKPAVCPAGNRKRRKGSTSRKGDRHRICEHGRHHRVCKECGGSGICEHGRIRNRCKECGGSSLCEHGRLQSQCRDCGGASICEHGRLRNRCKECGGASICEHGRQRNYCKECGGSSICPHGRQKSRCKECASISTSTCEHGRHRSRCKTCRQPNTCVHGRRRAYCKECGGTSLCVHMKVPSKCKACGGSAYCEHGRQRSKCKECGGSGICQHNRRRSECRDCGGGGFCEHGRRRCRCKLCQAVRRKADAAKQ